MLLQALFDFTLRAQDSDKTLPFDKDDVFLFMEVYPKDENWLKVVDVHGRIGYIPKNYVEVTGQFGKHECLDFIKEAIYNSKQRNLSTTEDLIRIKEKLSWLEYRDVLARSLREAMPVERSEKYHNRKTMARKSEQDLGVSDTDDKDEEPPRDYPYDKRNSVIDEDRHSKYGNPKRFPRAKKGYSSSSLFVAPLEVSAQSGSKNNVHRKSSSRTEFDRESDVGIPPPLKQLDGNKDAPKSERYIKARQKFEDKEMVLMSEETYFRDKKGKRPSTAPTGMKAVERGSGDEGNMLGNLDSKEEARENDKGAYWSKVTGNLPESTQECRMLECQQDRMRSGSNENIKPQKTPRYFGNDDQPLNCNEPKLSFTLNNDMDRNLITLDLAVPWHMCTTMIDADVQPNYLRVTVKGKIFQLRLCEEVKPESSFAQRSQITGHLIITMPKVNQNSILVWKGSNSQVIDLTTTASEGSQEMKSKLNRGDTTEIIEGKKASKSKFVKKKVRDSDSDCTSRTDDLY